MCVCVFRESKKVIEKALSHRTFRRARILLTFECRPRSPQLYRLWKDVCSCNNDNPLPSLTSFTCWSLLSACLFSGHQIWLCCALYVSVGPDKWCSLTITKYRHFKCAQDAYRIRGIYIYIIEPVHTDNKQLKHNQHSSVYCFGKGFKEKFWKWKIDSDSRQCKTKYVSHY